jgi:hypothetical protein
LKLYSDPTKAELIDYFWSENTKKTVKGINVVTLYYTDVKGMSLQVNYRLVNKNQVRLSLSYFLEMMAEL